tara:strand:+ start:1910 stop:2242 length:333 start_codon:yes stop_codon:yes gene_type:complete
MNDDYKITLNDNFDTEQTFTVNIGDLITEEDQLSFDFSTTDTNTITLTDYKNKTLDVDHIEDMASEYPALGKAWKTFKSFYDLCKDEYAVKVNDNDWKDNYSQDPKYYDF